MINQVGTGVEIDTYEFDNMLFVLASNGRKYSFYKTDDDSNSWIKSYNGYTKDGIIYLYSDDCIYTNSTRRIDAERNVYEPVYEKQFSSGYAPIFALDVSKEQSYQCMLYGVNAEGTPVFEENLPVIYGNRDWSVASEDFIFEHSGYDVLQTTSGEVFLQTFNDWTKQIEETGTLKSDNIDVQSDGGVPESTVLDVTYSYPEVILISQGEYGETSYEAGLNTMEAALYDCNDGQATLELRENWAVDLTELINADTVTLEMLQDAASHAMQNMSADSVSYYTKKYTVDEPTDVRDLWYQVSEKLTWEE